MLINLDKFIFFTGEAIYPLGFAALLAKNVYLCCKNTDFLDNKKRLVRKNKPFCIVKISKTTVYSAFGLRMLGSTIGR